MQTNLAYFISKSTLPEVLFSHTGHFSPSFIAGELEPADDLQSSIISPVWNIRMNRWFTIF